MAEINVRQIVLETIREQGEGKRTFSAANAMKAIVGKAKGAECRREALTCWNDLLSAGIIALANPDQNYREWNQAPLCYFATDRGEKTCESASRDPQNPDGYLAYLDSEAKIDSVTRGYVEEAVRTYRSCCYKAAAVMIGAATENLVLDLRDEMVARLKARGDKIPSQLGDWKVKTVLESIASLMIPELQNEKKRNKDDTALRQLSDDAEARLLPTAAEFRKTRNDAGHPASLDPVHPADVHCNLLLFPATAKLIGRLTLQRYISSGVRCFWRDIRAARLRCW